MAFECGKMIEDCERTAVDGFLDEAIAGSHKDEGEL